MYGIINVRYSQRTNKFLRRWVFLPPGEALLFATLAEAVDKADALSLELRETGVDGQDFRARKYDRNYI